MNTETRFDFWPILFLIAAVQGIFMALVLWQWKRGICLGNRLIATLLLLFSVTLVEYILYWTQYLQYFPHFANISSELPFLFGPIVWFYLRSIYQGKSLSVKDSWHVLPFLISFAFHTSWYLMGTSEKSAVIAGIEPYPINKEWIALNNYLRVGHLLIYAIWNFRFIHQQAQVGHTKGWSLLLNGFFMGYSVAYLSYFVLVLFPFFSPFWDYQISIAMSAFIYLIAWFGYMQPSVFDGFALRESAGLVKYKNSGLSEQASQRLLQHLDQYMQESRAWQDPEIGLEKLSIALGSTKHHVSQVINEHLHCSFFEYVNQLRVEEAKILLSTHSRQTLYVIEVAYSVGFNNKVSFNTAFKKATGLTPTEYRGQATSKVNQDQNG